MDCRDVTTQLADYLAGTLTDEQLDAVRGHLAGCAPCREELEAADDTWQALAAIEPVAPDSAAMRGRFEAMLAGYAQAAGEVTPAWSVRRTLSSWWRPQLALQAAAAAALLVAGIAIGRHGVADTATSDSASSGTASSDSAATRGGVDQIAALRQELGDMRQMMTLSLLQQQSASERLRGVTFTSQIPQPGSEVVVSALLDTLMHDQNVNVRLASIDALKRFAASDAVRRGTMAALPRQTSPLVQLALIDFVLETAGAESVESLRALSREGMLDDAVRTRLTRGLQQLGATL